VVEVRASMDTLVILPTCSSAECNIGSVSSMRYIVHSSKAMNLPPTPFRDRGRTPAASEADLLQQPFDGTAISSAIKCNDTTILLL